VAAPLDKQADSEAAENGQHPDATPTPLAPGQFAAIGSGARMPPFRPGVRSSRPPPGWRGMSQKSKALI
jgi:hypothetical protein